ncbi:TRAP transporter small permease [Yoonia sp. SS1-5]|uniref:TRAP transporter small permease protein n=1 Tax=Yoonia rhodophyticola TaxID=3137370 RepID=A0ABZ3JCA1_9RHOB
MGIVRRTLDGMYTVSGVLAGLCLIAILCLIIIQMLARWTGEVFPGAPDYAGYAMAAASFLAFANALNKGSHIRVSIVLNAVGPRARLWLEIWCFAIGAATAWYVSYYSYRMLGFAIKFNDVSQGQDATPLWIPQSAMLVGMIILAIALTDNLLTLLTTGQHRIIRDVTDTQAE